MSSDRTEKPTQKKLKEAREKGQVARSADLAGAAAVAAVTIALGRLGPGVLTTLADHVNRTLSQLGDAPRLPLEMQNLAPLIWQNGGMLAVIVGPLALTASLVSVGFTTAQGGWVYSPKAIRTDWSRLSPKAGLQRLSPGPLGVQLLKGAVGVGVIAVIGYAAGEELYRHAADMLGMSIGQAGLFAWNAVWAVLWRSSLALMVVGGGDYVWQRYRVGSQLKMSRQEIRDESKLNEGSPEIKARVRRVQRDIMRRRMLSNVKRATVVITNPTHYAVALEYERTTMAAPVVVAKGQDSMALRIRQIAREHNVPIVENPPVARALHRDAEIGDVIPPALFNAVAEVLAYLVRLRQLTL